MTLSLTPRIEGNAAGPTLFFIQGWPDDASLWDPLVSALRASYRCVRVTLPNFDGARTSRWGYRTEEIVDALIAVLEQVSEQGPVTLVLHDWGSYWGHAVHHRCPERVARVATLDVSPHFRPGLLASLGVITYQGWLGGAFLLGGPIGDWMTRRFARLARAPRSPETLHAWMNYPYRNIFGDLASGRAKRLTHGYWPTCPLLFVHGEKKPLQFHSQAWVEHVKKTGGTATSLPCGHWVPLEPAVIEVLRTWLDATEASSPGVEARRHA